MNPSRVSDEALDKHLQQLNVTIANRKHNMKKIYAMPRPPPPPTPPPEPMRLRSDSAATSIYVMGNNSSNKDPYSSNSATIDRKQEHRLSWGNMRRRAEGSIGGGVGPPTTPSPQTTRSYTSNITTTEIISTADDRGGGLGGTVSGRTTATSGRISSSGITTICGSNNTLNDMHSDYHSQDVGAVSDFHNFSRIGVSPMKQHLSTTSSFNLANGSTVKLITVADDESNQQVSF